MSPTAAQIEERMPVWEALSELFLDTELQPADHERIASLLAATSYSEQDLFEILNHEVYPACVWNLVGVAGEWQGFHPDWIREKVAPHFGRRPLVRHLYPRRWATGRDWKIVRARIAQLRNSSKKPP